MSNIYTALYHAGTHIGVVKFSSSAFVEVSLQTDHQNRCYIKRHVAAMMFTNGATYVDLGLEKTYKELFVKHGRPLHQATRVLLILTDGVSSRGM